MVVLGLLAVSLVAGAFTASRVEGGNRRRILVFLGVSAATSAVLLSFGARPLVQWLFFS